MKYLLLTLISLSLPVFAAKPTDVVAKVGSSNITVKEFEQHYDTTKTAINRPSKSVFLEDLIRYEMGIQEAAKMNLQNDPIIKEKMRQQMYALLVERAIGKQVEAIKVSEKEMQAEYVRSPELRSSHILIEFTPSATAQQKSIAKKNAFEILNKVKTSKRPFEELVKLYSDDAITKTAGGDVGFLTRVTAVPPYYNALRSLKVNQVYPQIIETQYGFHIVKLTGRRTYEQADRTQLRAIVFEKKRKILFDKYFANLKKKYKIAVNQGVLKTL